MSQQALDETGTDGSDAAAASAAPEGATTPPAPEGATTPMMTQYLAIKRAHPDCLLFYRMGDFYELFFEDAHAAARALDITLTHRGKHLGDDIPMCGVPVHSHESYLSRLIRQGFKVAVCEQTEDPAEAKKRGAKSVVARDVVRLITPGTLTEETLLDAGRNNFLAALAEAQGALAIAWLDISTGEFSVAPVDAAALPAALARIQPGELLVSDRLAEKPEAARLLRSLREDGATAVTIEPASLFDSANGEARLKKLFSVATLDAFGRFDRAALAAAGALVDYVELTQKGALPRIAPPRAVAPGESMEIDAQTRRNLELTVASAGGRRGTLLDVIDRTRTGAGARLVASLLAAPLTDAGEINRRLDVVDWLASDAGPAATVTRVLDGTPDLERALARITVGRGGPRDLAAVREGSPPRRPLPAISGNRRRPRAAAAARRGMARDAGRPRRAHRPAGEGACRRPAAADPRRRLRRQGVRRGARRDPLLARREPRA